MDNLEKIYLGGGCFWCVEAVFQNLKGVKSVVSGFMDGHLVNPTYRDVCTGFSGHNEVVEISFDPNIITLKNLLYVFFTSHDPTTLNRQGNDIGTQYRSGIYATSDDQKEMSKSFIQNEAAEIWDNNIVTEVKSASKFYPAEDYHQDYFNNNQKQGYCRIIIEPKVNKVKEKFKHLLNDEREKV
ncbi:MAG: peptide-methionine (S)-S-oxide reductase MsrA [Saprospiraceae bacterium]|nr:peptide-methionine (S)-S-oxide reductase MsrA [Bacteroidia bacterium]NNL91147.1 peptide-methionine (S)-S-oxide reductase MsrA [Saprospiraceae bacterium]